MNEIPEDPIVAEIHAIRQALLDDCGGDITEYRRRALARQAASDRRIITKPFRNRTEQTVAVERRNRPCSGGE
jgi:hypothetical protein